MSNVVIRQAQDVDLPVLLEFEQGLISAERPFDPTLVSERFSYYDLKQMIESDEAEVVVATIGGELVGSGHARIRTGESFNQFEKYAFFGFMYSSPEHRGKGINKLIMDELFKWAKSRELTEIRLQVYDENSPAIRAYEKVGFKKVLTTMRLHSDC
jgi:ribosomal protein S18 acetylase RimI-like enzyme